MRGLWLRYFLAVGAERDIQKCRHKSRLVIAILYTVMTMAVSRFQLLSHSRPEDVTTGKCHSTSAHFYARRDCFAYSRVRLQLPLALLFFITITYI